jgi:hypothetical protein
MLISQWQVVEDKTLVEEENIKGKYIEQMNKLAMDSGPLL